MPSLRPVEPWPELLPEARAEGAVPERAGPPLAYGPAAREAGGGRPLPGLRAARDPGHPARGRRRRPRLGGRRPRARERPRPVPALPPPQDEGRPRSPGGAPAGRCLLRRGAIPRPPPGSRKKARRPPPSSRPCPSSAARADPLSSRLRRPVQSSAGTPCRWILARRASTTPPSSPSPRARL